MQSVLGGIALRVVCMILALLQSLGIDTAIIGKSNVKAEWNTNYTYVLVHGLIGWGDYRTLFNYEIPYYGLLSYDISDYLNLKGFDCVKADTGLLESSSWDRACEVYAELTGTVVDYGEAHSEKYGHKRYGKDFSKDPLVKKWDSENKVNLIGHSFGGLTVRRLVDLLANGSKEEKAATTDGSLSPLFEGGKGDWVYSVTCLSTPLNGTSAAECGDTLEKLFKEVYEGDMVDLSADAKVILNKQICRLLFNLTEFCANPTGPGYDSPMWELCPDGAKLLNDELGFEDNIYYFSVPTLTTVPDSNGKYQIPTKDTDPFVTYSSYIIGRTMYTTAGGIKIDESWLPNDGLVNTISEYAPFDDKSHEISCSPDEVTYGMWNQLPLAPTSHAGYLGGLLKAEDVRHYYDDLCGMINSIK